MRLFLSLGSNLGNREENISQALSMLNNAFKKDYEALSSIIETKSWGYTGNDFLNCCVRYDIDIEPKEVLKVCKSIEKQMGRSQTQIFDEKGNRVYKDRIIDIDILIYGDIKINTDELTIPHPLMEKREFVMRPLKEIIN